MTIFVLTIRQLMSGTRWIILCVLAAVPPLLSLLDVLTSSERVFMQAGLQEFVAGVIVPIIPLLLTGSAFASDIDEGTAVYVLAKPIPRIRILFEKFGATVLLALLLSLSSALLSIFIQRSQIDNYGSLLTAYAAAITVGTIAYTAIFLALSLVTRRGILIGLMYILVWETMLAGQFAGTRTLSVKEYMSSIASSLDRSGFAQEVSTIAVSTALLMSAVLGTLAIALAWRRLQNFEVSEQG